MKDKGEAVSDSGGADWLGVSLTTDGVVEAPSWFGPADRPLFGWFVFPADRRVRGAVVLCQPLAEEGNMAYRTFRRLSQRLAHEGFLALRFDYDGTGDSAGSFEDSDRVGSWAGSVRHAVEAVRGWGVAVVSLVGMRLGATVAYTALAESKLDIDHLVLWDPCATGRSFLRELQMLHTPWLETRRRSPEGWVETPSYRFTPAAAAAVRALEIDGRKPVTELAHRTSVLARPDRAGPAALRKGLPAPEVEWREALGQAELLNVPTIAAAVPEEGVAEVVACLLDAARERSTTVVPAASVHATWVEAGQTVHETARFFGPNSDLFGIQTQPAQTDAAVHESPPSVLFLNVAAERHLGEGRMWLTLGRGLVRHGFTSVRMDHSGVGDSATRAGHVDDTVYDPGWLDDVPAVARELSQVPRHDVVGIGLCSGASSALEAAMHGALLGVIGVNIGLAVKAERTNLCEWDSFRRLPRWLTRLATRHYRASMAIWRAHSIVSPRSANMWAPRSIVVGGTDVTILCGDDDMDALRQHPVWRATWGRVLTRSGRFRMIRMPNADHSLRVSSGQDEVAAAIVHQLRLIAASNPERSRHLAR